MLFKLFSPIIDLQNNINKIVMKKLDIFVIIYLNDMLIYIKNPN